MTDTDVIALKELVSLVEPIKAVIKEYNTRIAHDNVIDIEPIEIKLDDKIGVVGKAVGMYIKNGKSLPINIKRTSKVTNY